MAAHARNLQTVDLIRSYVEQVIVKVRFDQLRISKAILRQNFTLDEDLLVFVITIRQTNEIILDVYG